jgi:tRNA(Ile2) C34 agmatinyltransferase TiaS
MDRLILFICPACGKEIAWAGEKATVYCKKCDRWIKAKEIKAANCAKMDAKTGQLILF